VAAKPRENHIPGKVMGREENRTEQNRTEQNRTEQNRREKIREGKGWTALLNY